MCLYLWNAQVTWGGGNCKLHLRGMSVFERSQQSGYKSIQVSIQDDQLQTFKTQITKVDNHSWTVDGTVLITAGTVGREGTMIILTREHQTTTCVRYCHSYCNQNIVPLWKLDKRAFDCKLFYYLPNQWDPDDQMDFVDLATGQHIRTHQVGNMLMTR